MPENISRGLKEKLKKQLQHIKEGNESRQAKKRLDQVYTKMYITQAKAVKEHEVCMIDTIGEQSNDKEIECNNIFSQEGNPRTVLTKGNAGIGKTVCIQKFVLDWVKGQANENIKLVLVLPFRELNLRQGEHSLHTLLSDFYPELAEVDDPQLYNSDETVFIFDGLDESKFQLDFSRKRQCVTDIYQKTTLNVIIASLIEGKLLDSARIWITSRPAAVSEDLCDHIDQITEVKGFNDQQKEEYFHKKFSNPPLADKIVAHIKSNRILYMMCQIPLFCWLAAKVFQKMLQESGKKDLPRTLTSMYCHFLLVQIYLTCKKNDDSDGEVREKCLKSKQTVLLKVAELAFRQLQKDDVYFEKEDLMEYGIKAEDALVSDMCAEILKEEAISVVDKPRKIYCFRHLSIQEFLAALYAFHCLSSENLTPLKPMLALGKKSVPEVLSVDEFLKMAVNMALKDKKGHFDLFVRFLHGLTLESNRGILKGLLPQIQVNTATIEKIINSLKKIQRKNISAERCLNLFHCLSEMNDCSVQEEVQKLLDSERDCVSTLSMAHCSGLAFMLKHAEVQEEFNLAKYNTSDEGRKRLVPAVENCIRANLAGCKLTENSCDVVASALQSENSPLRELDLSDNDLQDAGIKIMCFGLKSRNCKLEKLNLSCCGITETGFIHLASALGSNGSCCLKEIDLSRNYPTIKGKKRMSKALKKSQCTLSCNDEAEYWLKSGLQKYACKITVDLKTAYRKLYVKNQKVEVDSQDQQRTNHPEQFLHCQQFLCTEELRRKAYWEVDWNKHAVIGVAYKSIHRDGQDESKLGCNDSSWSLECFIGSYVAKHDNLTETIPAPRSRSGRVAVFLDWEGGTLTFYTISSGALSHLHTFHATFTESLFPGCEVFNCVTLWQPPKKKGAQ